MLKSLILTKTKRKVSLSIKETMDPPKERSKQIIS